MTICSVMKKSVPAVLLGAALLLSGCTTSPVVPDNAAHAMRTQAKTIDVTGRLSMRFERHGAEEASHGSFTWSQAPQHTQVQLLSPLGQIVASIDITQKSATLKQPNRPAEIAKDADILTQQVLGWPLPVTGLRDWLQGFGIDEQGRPFTAHPSSDSTRFTTQDGWQVTYTGWEPSTGNQYRPKRIDLSRETQQAGRVAIRLVIDTWQTR